MPFPLQIYIVLQFYNIKIPYLSIFFDHFGYIVTSVYKNLSINVYFTEIIVIYKNVIMNISKFSKVLIFALILPFLLNSCKSQDGKFKLPGGDARKTPADPKKRIEQNLSEGKGFRLKNLGGKKGGVFDFASSNELWRASLDVLDFMPLSSVNYSGGIIITDWYGNNQNPNESIKISVRFLTNEIRSDALDIKVFTRKCTSSLNCEVFEGNKIVAQELRKQILKGAAKYSSEQEEKTKEKNKKYTYPSTDGNVF